MASSPLGPSDRSRRLVPWFIVLAAVAVAGLVIGVVVAVTGDGPSPLPPEVLPTSSAPFTAPTAPIPSTAPTAPDSGGPGAGGPGALTTGYLLSLIGSDASSDEVSALDAQCGSNIDAVGNLECPSLGFEITFDASMTATRVILYPAQEDSMSEFTGSLPGNVSWSDSYPDVLARLGQPVELEGGFGAIDLTAHYQMDGYDIGYGLDTWYNSPDYLQNAHLTSITIRPL